MGTEKLRKEGETKHKKKRDKIKKNTRKERKMNEKMKSHISGMNLVTGFNFLPLLTYYQCDATHTKFQSAEHAGFLRV